MEVFPPDDPQSNEVGNRPTVSRLEQIKAWDDSFANLEKVLQACETSDAHKELNSCSREPAVSSVAAALSENPVNKTDTKRKWEDEIVDSVETNNQKLKRMNNMILSSGEVTIQLVNSPSENCDSLPLSNLLSSIKTETKSKYENFSFDMPTEKVQSDKKNAIEFIKLDSKAENSDIKIEKKPDIFSDLEKTSCIKEENSFTTDMKMIVSREIKSDSGFTDDLSTESKNDFDDPLSYSIKDDDSDFKTKVESKCPLLTDASDTMSDKLSTIASCPSPTDNEALVSCNKTEATEQTFEDNKDEKDKKEDAVDRSLKKDDKLSKKKKFERCNIRDIKLEEELDAVTLSAQKEEQERIRRLQEAQMRALQERLQQIEVEKEALSQLFSQSTGDTPNLFDANSLAEAEVPPDEKKVTVKTESDVVLVESSDEDKKAKLQNVISNAIATPIEENIIDISSSSSGNESDSDDSGKKDDDIMVLSDEGGADEGESAEDPNNSGAHTNDCFNLPDEEGRVLVNVGHPPEDPDIFLAPQIAKVIKPHQIGGIRFLYDNVVENLERYKSSSGFGCILAHSMGLGKTVQVVSFVDVFLRHTPATLVLCIVPINTIQNWKAEFDMWVPPSNYIDDALVLSGEVRPRDYNIYTLNENFKTMAARSSLIAEWRKNGGVLLMGYEMYRMLALRKMPKIPVKKSKRLKKQEMNVEPETNEQIKKYMDEMYNHIVIPGPDLVICDEGHRIKNSLASTSMALKSIKTRRRVVLTGYPLQNNLLEYWCMVDFVRPNYLGSRAEFCNMFERPISNGQCIDSTPRDRQLMRFRSHVLHSLLVGFVQRRGHSVLRAVLPKKEEHVLLVRMTPIQRQLYKCFVKDLLYVQQATNPLKLFAVCCKIWNHPDILYKLLQEKKAQEDIDLDIDITVAGSSGVSGANCGIRKRAYQNKSKAVQRSVKALPRGIKSEPNFNSVNDSIKTEQVGCESGTTQQVNDMKYDSHDTNKEEGYVTPQNEYSQQVPQSFQNSYGLKSSLNSPFSQSNYDVPSNIQYSANNPNNIQYTSKSSLLSPQQQFNSPTSESTSHLYSQSSTMETQYGQQPPNQFSLGNSQHFTQADSQIQSPYGICANMSQDSAAVANHAQSPTHSNFQTKSSQSKNCVSYSQQSDLMKQMQNSSQDHFSNQSTSNQDTSFPQSPLSSNQKFVQSSQQYSQSSQQSFSNTQPSQQYSQQQAFSQASRPQFSDQQSSQFSQQTLGNQSQTSFSKLPSESTSNSEQPSVQHYSSQTSFQNSPQSQFTQNHTSQQSPSAPHQQFPHQTSYSQLPHTQQYNQQQSAHATSSQQPSPTQTQFPQVSSNQSYSQQYSQQSPEYSQSSAQPFQQQNLQTFSDQQAVQTQFHSSHQSYSDTSQAFSQQSFSQSYLQGSQQYPEQSSQENITSNFGTSQQFQHQALQSAKFSSKQGQQGNFSQQQQSSGESTTYPQSSQSVGQKQVCNSPSDKGNNKQPKFNQQSYSEQHSPDSQFSQIGQSAGFSQQLSQSNTPSFSEQMTNITSQYAVQQTTLQFSSQIPNSSQYNSQTAKSGESFSQQASQQFPQQGNQPSEPYVQPSQDYDQQNSQYSQSVQNSQQFSQQSTNAQQFDSNSQTQLFSQQTQHNQFSQQSSQSKKSYSQEVSQTSQTCSQQSIQKSASYNQQVSTSFSQQQPHMTQQFSTQVPQSQQYSQQTSQPFIQQQTQSSQQYNQTSAQSSQLYTQQPSVSSQYSQPSQSSQEFNLQPSHSSPQFNQHNQSSSQYNQQSMTSQIFNESVGQSPQIFNQATQPSQQYNTSNSAPSQFNQSSSQSQQFSASETQASQINQNTVPSPQQFNQGSTQASQSFDKSMNQTSQQYNQQSNQSSQQFNQTSQMYNQPPSQTYKQTLQSSQYNQNNLNSQQFNQSSQSQFSQKNLQGSQQYSQQSYSQQTSQSPQQYTQQPAQSPQHFNQPVQSPQQFSQPVQSPQQFPQQAAPSPQQYNQHPAQSPQQYNQHPAHSPQQFSQPPTPSAQQYQQTTPSPQQFLQQPSPQQFSQPSPSQQFSQPSPSPQQFSQPAPSPQQFSQPAPSPQHFPQPNQSPQQYSQPAASPQQFTQPSPSPQQFSQPAPSPQPFSQPTPSPQQFSQSAASPQQFNQQASQQNSQVQYAQQTSTQHLSQQSSQSSPTQQYSHLPTQSQYKQQSVHSGQSSQYTMSQQCTGTQSQQYNNSFSQSSNQSSMKSSFQADYQSQPNVSMSSQQVLSTQVANQQTGKQNSRGGKAKQSRAKSLSQALLPQTSAHSSLKQPPSFSVQAFQNGNPSVLQRPMGPQSVKSLQDNGNSLFQPLNSSISSQENFALQHITQDSSGSYPAKCSKAMLQQVKHQNQEIVQHSQINSDMLQGENEHKNSASSTDTAVVPFRDRMDSSINYEWAVPIMKDYVLGVLENSHKMMVLFVIIAETLQMGDKLLVFSQSLSTLDLLEQFLSKVQVPRKPDQSGQIVTETWARNKNYFRLDGSTSAQEREKLINEFNRNDNVSLFLLSTRAGCLGINLVGANRIVVMDASWNPCHDAQAVCRIYRYGQKKQCYIYRLVTDNSLEKRIYDRQVNKQGMSDRVVDELNPESNFTWKDVTTLIQDDEDDGPVQELSKFASSYTDRVLKYLVSEMSPSLSKEPFEHESLLLDRKDLKLTKQEKRLAKQSYEMAKRANMINIRTTYTYLPAGTAGGGQFIINNKQCQWVGGTTIRVLPNQNNSGSGNARSGTTATPITATPSLMSSLFKQGVMVQKLTMPSNVSIPVLTPGAPPVVIPAGQDVLVLRTPKGVYLRLPDGRIIAVQLPPSLLAKTQFRPNVVTHFRPAAPKGGNQSTVINTPRGQSIGIIKQTLQCGGTVRYLGPRNSAGSSGHNSNRSSAPEVIDLSDDDEPSLRKHGMASNTSANSSESESGSGDPEKSEKSPTVFPGKHITIRKITSNSHNVPSKEKCEIPQMLSKNKQITILPINPSSQQNRQKFAPQLAQPVRVQQMLLQPQQGKRKPVQKNTTKIQMSPLLSGKNVRPQITITQPASVHSNIQSQKVRQSPSLQNSKNLEFSDKTASEQNLASAKQSTDSSAVKMCERSAKSSPMTLQQSLQINKSSPVLTSESGKVHGNILPPSLAALAVNPNLQITPAPRSESSVSDLLPQKPCFQGKSLVQNSSTTSSLQSENSQNAHTLKSGLQITPASRPETSITEPLMIKTAQHSKSPVQNVNISPSVPAEQLNNVVSTVKSTLQISPSSEPTSVSDLLPHRTLFHSKSPVQNAGGLQTEQSHNMVQSLNPNLQITPVPRSESSSSSDLYPRPKSTALNSLVTTGTQLEHSVHSINSITKTTHLTAKTENTVPQVSVSQNISSKSSTSQQLTNFSDTLSTSSSQIQNQQLQNSVQPSSFQQLLSQQSNNEIKHKPQNQSHSTPYSSQSLPNTQMSFVSSVSSLPVSQNQHVAPRKRKSSNKQPSKKSQQQSLQQPQQQHLLMSQNHVLQSQTMESPQQFLHPQLSDHLLPENHFPTFSHHISGSDFTAFSNFSSHKAAAHIQHPQPLHPLQHSQEHSLLPHLQHMSHLYPMPPHLTGTSLPDTQPPAPRAWPVPQPSVSSFHPFSQSSPFFSSGQESSQFSFPSSFPLPPSTLTPSLTQSDSNANVASGSEKSSRISTSDM